MRLPLLLCRVFGSNNIFLCNNMKYIDTTKPCVTATPNIICIYILTIAGTYFNCIMFMVASSVVSTIMILNYHHRLADTHEMPNWVS